MDLLDRDPEFIAHRRDGRTVWARPLADLFGPGFSTDNGWNFEKYGGYYVGTLGAVSRFGHRTGGLRLVSTAGAVAAYPV